ncbi:hypothetical protein ACJMK2_008609 [Sinanodonta woodiana]|uniref:Leucine-rich repeat-containing protein 71 n=1 Tax=Sinanodonta woodiana TaxID=1069815 RepID=A0ABD3VM43_SINWO
MGKKIEKGGNKEKNASATSQDEEDPNKALEPHICTGNFQADFTELCRRNNMAVIPPVVLRPRPPGMSIQPETKPEKGGGKGKQPQPEPEPDPELNEDGEHADAPPKTYVVKENKFEYFKPTVQVEMDNPDKPDTVSEIFIRGWKIDDTMMGTLRQCLPLLEKLHTINFWNTGLTGNTIHTLASFLPQCPNLKTVILDANASKEEMWYELIQDESPIVNLSLRHCGITDEGATMIGRCLGSTKKSNVKLLSLNLSNNKISDKGATEIAQGLRMNRTLLSLSLANNQIGDKGASKLAEVLQKFPLTHEEVVERRKLLSDKGSPDRNKSPPLSRRADSKDRPGSVRSGTHADKTDKGGKKDKQSAKGKKDVKGGKEPEKEEKHDKKGGKPVKEDKSASKKGGGSTSLGGRSSGASMINEPGKGGKGPGKPGGKKPGDKLKPGSQADEVFDSPEVINPLLEHSDLVKGQLWNSGNRVLINLNLSRNQIGEMGMNSLLLSIEHQSFNSSSSTGLMRLCISKNRIAADHPTVTKLLSTVEKNDPFYKPPPQTPEEKS